MVYTSVEFALILGIWDLKISSYDAVTGEDTTEQTGMMFDNVMDPGTLYPTEFFPGEPALAIYDIPNRVAIGEMTV